MQTRRRKNYKPENSFLLIENLQHNPENKHKKLRNLKEFKAPK